MTAAFLAPIARATDVTGTVQLQGLVTFAAPIGGITFTDLEIGATETTEATGNGESCTVQATTTDNADLGGAYPDTGTVSVTMLLHHGGMTVPTGDCIITVQARGTDGVSVSARGSQTIFLTAADIGGNATVIVPTITVGESKAVSGQSLDCIKWTKKQLVKRAKCNFLLLKKGPDAAIKCKDAGPEPSNCDPGNFVEAILALSHGNNDQQTDAMNAQGVDYTMLKDQVLCQKRFGKAAAKFAAKRVKLIQKNCIDQALDSQSCREMQSNTAKKKLDTIDNCSTAQLVDGGSGLIVPDVAAPCDTCIVAGTIDRKCLKDCFQIAVGDLSDSILGDLPECGDGILQPSGGESCDDGNTTSGDGCSDTCAIE